MENNLTLIALSTYLESDAVDPVQLFVFQETLNTRVALFVFTKLLPLSSCT